jgi:hypothetical protein
MKKNILLSVLIVFLAGCSFVSQPINQKQESLPVNQSIVNTNQPTPVKVDLITSPAEIAQMEKINDFYILQDKDYQNNKIYFLAKNYQINETELWNAAPTGIEQKGEFYLYLGKLEDLNEKNALKIGEMLFSGTKNYFEIKSLKSVDFVVIEQYEMNNFSKFYFYQIKNDSLLPVKFDSANSLFASWTIKDIAFADNSLTAYGYFGGQPVDYAETYSEYVWDGKNFSLLLKKTVMGDQKNKYSLYLGTDKTQPTWESLWEKDSEKNDFYISADKQLVVFSKIGQGNDKSKLILHKRKTDQEIIITADAEATYQIEAEKSNDQEIYYLVNGLDSPPYEYVFNIATGKSTYTHNLDQYFDRFKY